MKVPLNDTITGLTLWIDVESHPSGVPGLVVNRAPAWNRTEDWHESKWWSITHEVSLLEVDWGFATRIEAMQTAKAIAHLADWTAPVEIIRIRWPEIRKALTDLRWELSRAGRRSA